MRPRGESHAESRCRMNAEKKPTLVWSEDGQIGCTLPTHAPYAWSDTWSSERWRPMTLSDRVQFEAEVGRAPECESCAAMARQEARS